MVEVVIVLAISALVIVTTTIPYQKRNAELSEEQFWRDVKQRWQEAQTRARVEGNEQSMRDYMARNPNPGPGRGKGDLYLFDEPIEARN